jgi:hypothetical protein
MRLGLVLLTEARISKGLGVNDGSGWVDKDIGVRTLTEEVRYSTTMHAGL